MARLISRNVNHRDVREQPAASYADIALLQEGPQPPMPALDTAQAVMGFPPGPDPWETCGWQQPWRTAIARLSPDIEFRPIPCGHMAASADTLRVSRPGTLTEVTVVAGSKEPLTVVWGYPVPTDSFSKLPEPRLSPCVWPRSLPA